MRYGIHHQTAVREAHRQDGRPGYDGVSEPGERRGAFKPGNGVGVEKGVWEGEEPKGS